MGDLPVKMVSGFDCIDGHFWSLGDEDGRRSPVSVLKELSPPRTRRAALCYGHPRAWGRAQSAGLTTLLAWGRGGGECPSRLKGLFLSDACCSLTGRPFYLQMHFSPREAQWGPPPSTACSGELEGSAWSWRRSRGGRGVCTWHTCCGVVCLAQQLFSSLSGFFSFQEN